jgi:dATP pyrophosphohydrolase
MPDNAGVKQESRRPESVLVVVYAMTGEVLLLHRRRPAAFWQSVTGSLWTGESHAAAARRELAEETGLVDPPALEYAGVSRLFTIDPRWRDRYACGVFDNVEFEWRCALPAPVDITLCDREHDAAEWCALDEAIDRVWSWTNRAAFESLRRELG